MQPCLYEKIPMARRTRLILTAEVTSTLTNQVFCEMLINLVKPYFRWLCNQFCTTGLQVDNENFVTRQQDNKIFK
jgi:hypothetical protein